MCNFKLFDDPFGFQFSSNKDGEPIVHTNGSTIVYFDKYIQLDLQLPSQNIYGLGERNREFTLDEGTWTMWANGQETPYDDGTGSLQTYGVHPFALVQTAEKTQFMGIYFRNSNAMSPIITHTDGGKSTLSYISTGGTVEIYFILKGSAKDVIKTYQGIVGKA
jgi:alpha-glucosidase (family GH31 glycosyl hydrolase)